LDVFTLAGDELEKTFALWYQLMLYREDEKLTRYS